MHDHPEKTNKIKLAKPSKIKCGKVPEGHPAKGAAASWNEEPFAGFDTASLRALELIVFDDFRLDLKAIDPESGKVVKMMAYLAIDVASRKIIGHLVCPVGGANEGVMDALVGHVLRTHGMGCGYATYLVFERGVTGCSERQQRTIENLSGGEIKVFREGLPPRLASPIRRVIEELNRSFHKAMNAFAPLNESHPLLSGGEVATVIDGIVHPEAGQNNE